MLNIIETDMSDAQNSHITILNTGNHI